MLDPPAASASADDAVSQAKRRCLNLRSLALHSLPPPKISPSSKLTLLRLIDAELRFLSRLPPSSLPNFSPNVGHLESIFRTILLPSVHRVSRLSKPVLPNAHVDLVCTVDRSPAWFLISDRNPNFISWLGSDRKTGLRRRIDALVAAAHSAHALKPASIFLAFFKGVADDVAMGIVEEFGALEVDLLEDVRAFEIKIGGESGDEKVKVLRGLEVGNGVGLGDGGFGSLVSSLSKSGEDVVNFDTTALVALVSGISNGGGERLLKEPEVEMRGRFKGNYEFVIGQVMSELEHPILTDLRDILPGKKGIVCESVCSEFKELVSMCAGPNEKLRADQLLRHLLIVPDSPSDRVVGLPTSRKIAVKNKIVFGTGDYWQAPTLTANMGFVRAISQTGMSLMTIEHRPRALTGD